MGLSCGCDDWYPEPGDTYINHVTNAKPLSTKTRKRCANCKTLINIGDETTEFFRVKCPEMNSVEEKIYGEEGEIPRASHYLCERCGDLHDSLEELGYCFPINGIDEALQDYQELTNDK